MNKSLKAAIEEKQITLTDKFHKICFNLGAQDMYDLLMPEIQAMRQALDKFKVIFEQQNFDIENGIIGEYFKNISNLIYTKSEE